MEEKKIKSGLNALVAVQVYSSIISHISETNTFLGILAESKGRPSPDMTDEQAAEHLRTAESMLKVCEGSVVRIEKLIKDFYHAKGTVFTPKVPTKKDEN